MNKRITNEKIIRVAKCCITGNCKSCPLENDEKCATNFLNCVIEYMENESTPVATDTSSEVSKDTNSAHIDDSKLLDICQKELEKISEIALGDFPNTYLIEYVEYIKNTIKKLRGGDGNV